MTLNMTLLCLAVASPFLGGVGVALFGQALGERCSRLGITALWVSVAGSLATFLTVLQGEPTVWMFSEGPFGFTLVADRLAGVMIVLVSLVSLVIHVYSARYMTGDPGYRKFFVLLGLLTTVLLGLVTSGNLLWMFAFWHAVSWILASLLAFNGANRAPIDAGRRTLRILALGDVGFALGTALLYAAYGTLDLQDLFERVGGGVVPRDAGVVLGMEVNVPLISTLCFLLAVMTKSAQFPFHIWLPGTIEAPTPVSALLHAGIVNAGGMLVNRLAPVFGAAPTTLHLMFLVGAVTALIGATSMLTEASVKRRLVYSTMGQMGYMVMECGLGAFALAVFHLCAHGLFKATLFLNSGVNIHLSRTEFQLPEPHAPRKSTGFSGLTWATGLGMTLLLPLGILLIGHGLVQVPLFEVQGATIFLFFAWVTSSQAIFSMYRLQSSASWNVSLLMAATLAFIAVTYLWAGEAFTHFLYPGPDEAAEYFRAAAWPEGLFETFVVLSALLVLGVWMRLYATAHGIQMPVPDRLHKIWAWSYVAFLNNLYVEEALRAWRSRRSRGSLRLHEPGR